MYVIKQFEKDVLRALNSYMVTFLVALNSSLTIENVYGIKHFVEDVLHALNSYLGNEGTFVLNSLVLQRG